jgi:prephenate dehydrogenase
MIGPVAVVGRGLIGGSIELALRERQPQLGVVTIDRGDDLAACSNADLVVLSAPVCANIEILGRLRGILSSRTLITDVGSTKAAICAAAEGLRFIGGHPVAGAAQGGTANARADLFAGRTWILTTGAASDADAARLESFVAGLGAQPAWMEPESHDRLFAFVSHLPQLTISALMAVVGGAAGVRELQYAGPGLHDSTRLASSAPDIWADIVSTNRPAVREALDALIGALTELRDDDSGGALMRTFSRAAEARASLEATRAPGA